MRGSGRVDIMEIANIAILYFIKGKVIVEAEKNLLVACPCTCPP